MKVGTILRGAMYRIRMAGLVFCFACGVLMIVLIVLRLISGPSPVRSLKYSEPIQEIDRKNVRDAKVLTLKNTTEITGHLLHSDEVISVQLDGSQLQDTIQHLRDAQVPTTTAELVGQGPFGTYAIAAGVVCFLLIYFMILIWQMRLLRKSRKQWSSHST